MSIAARSTNIYGFVHYGGEVISGIEAGRGVRLPACATGATPVLEPFGDETNIGVTVKGKGSGAQTFGGSSGATVVAGTSIRLDGSVTASTGDAIKGAYSTTFSWTNASISSGQIAEITLSTSVGDVSPGDIISISLGTSLASPIIYGGFRTSTAVASRVTILVAVPGSSASSTLGSADGRISWIDLT